MYVGTSFVWACDVRGYMTLLAFVEGHQYDPWFKKGRGTTNPHFRYDRALRGLLTEVSSHIHFFCGYQTWSATHSQTTNYSGDNFSNAWFKLNHYLNGFIIKTVEVSFFYPQTSNRVTAHPGAAQGVNWVGWGRCHPEPVDMLKEPVNPHLIKKN